MSDEVRTVTGSGVLVDHWRETPVDRADPGEDPDARRRRVHEAGRTTVDRMRGES